eukprot:95525_1
MGNTNKRQKTQPKDEDNKTNENAEKNSHQSLEDILKRVSLEQAETNALCDHLTDMPLYTFRSEDIYNKIVQWIMNDIDYNKYLSKIIYALSDCQLPQELENMKLILKDKISEFMTNDTLNIIINFINEKITDIHMKSAAEIGYIICKIPLMSLKLITEVENIDGATFINEPQKLDQAIKIATGFKQEEIVQIKTILFRNKTLVKSEIQQNMNTVLTQQYGTKSTQLIINAILSKFDVEKLQLYLKKGNKKGLKPFSDAILKLANQLNENENKNDNNFTKTFYESIVKCFLTNSNECDNWICCNCNNYNFQCYIGGKMNNNVSICILCGISKKDSIIMQLRNDAKNNIDESNESIQLIVKEEWWQDKYNEADELIKKVNEINNFNLCCPDGIDSKPCESILRLAKYLLQCIWIENIYNNNKANDSYSINIEKYINDDTYQQIFIQSAKINVKISENDKKTLIQMLNDNKDNIDKTKTFLQLKKSQFTKIICQYITVETSISDKLYESIYERLKKKAETAAYDLFLSSLDLDIVDKDYNHILKSHFSHMSAEQSVLKFFQTIVHRDDFEQVEECMSVTRKRKNIR